MNRVLGWRFTGKSRHGIQLVIERRWTKSKAGVWQCERRVEYGEWGRPSGLVDAQARRLLYLSTASVEYAAKWSHLVATHFRFIPADKGWVLGSAEVIEIVNAARAVVELVVPR